MGVDAGPQDRVEHCLDVADRVEKIANEHDIGEALEHVGVGRCRLLDCRRDQHGDAFGGIAGEHRLAQADEAGAFAGGGQQVGQRQRQHDGAAALGNRRQARAEVHRGRQVGPQPDGVGGLPFLLAHIEMVVAGRASPVDRGRRFAGNEGAELPEGLAAAAHPASVPAGQNRGGDAPRLDQKVGHAGGDPLRLSECPPNGCGLVHAPVAIQSSPSVRQSRRGR